MNGDGHQDSNHGFDGDRSRVRTIDPCFAMVALPRERRLANASGRASSSRRGHSLDDERRAIRALTRTTSLRLLASEFGVSHGTVWMVVRGKGEQVA